MVIISITLIILIVAGYFIKKNFDIKWVMFGSGIALMGSAILLKVPLLPEESSSGIAFFDIFKSHWDIIYETVNKEPVLF